MLRIVGFVVCIAWVMSGCGQTQQANADAATPSATQTEMPSYPSLKAQVDRVAVYKVEGNYGKFIDNLHPKLVETMGGKESMLDSMIKEYERLNLEGATPVALAIGEPTQVEEVGGQIFAMMPATATTKSLEGDVVEEGSMIGISDDGGNNWKFLADIDQARFSTLFAEAAEKIRIPAKKQPALLNQ